jgi:hypothetical protein
MGKGLGDRFKIQYPGQGLDRILKGTKLSYRLSIIRTLSARPKGAVGPHGFYTLSSYIEGPHHVSIFMGEVVAMEHEFTRMGTKDAIDRVLVRQSWSAKGLH